MPVSKRSLAVLALLTLAVGCWAPVATSPVAAQTFPSKSIRILVGFPAGGGVDSVARIVGEQMARSLGQPVVVENKPGVGGTLVATELAKAEPDGHVLMVAAGGPAITGAIYKSLPFETVDSFSWISGVVTVPFFIAVHAESEFKTLAALLARGKAAPGTLTYGSVGAGSTHHLMIEMISLAMGAKFVHVPYRGDAPIVTDILGRHIQFGAATLTSLAGHMTGSTDGGKLRALAVTTGRRWPRHEQIPTVAEALGIADFDVGSWFALAGPPRIPKDTVAVLNAEVAKAVADPGVRAKLESLGGEVASTTPDELRGRVAREFAMWTGIMDRIGLAKQ